MRYWEVFKSLIISYFYSENIWRLAAAAAIIILTLLLRKLAIRIVAGIMARYVRKAGRDMDNKLKDAIVRPVGFAFLIIGLQLAAKVVSFSPGVYLFIDRAARSLILFALFWAAYRSSSAVTLLFRRLSEKTDARFDNMLVSFISSGLKIIIIVLGSITVAQVWFDELTGVLTGLGLGGLAFALAAKDTAANLFGSVTIMIDRPFTVGDWIKTPNVEGTVEEMGFRSTRVRTFEQAVVTIPNSVMSNDPITNWSRMGKRRLSYRLGLAYSTTPEQLKECLDRLRSLIGSHPQIHPETILAYFERFGDSSLDILVQFYTKATEYKSFLEVQQDINLKIMDILNELGISVAFPSRSVYIENNKQG